MIKIGLSSIRMNEYSFCINIKDQKGRTLVEQNKENSAV